MPDIQIIRAETPEDIAAVKALFIDYLQFVTDYLGQDLSFQGTEKEFADFPQTYTSLFLAKQGNTALGACGLKNLPTNLIDPNGIPELKRLYVSPAGRGHSLGQRLSQAVIDDARGHGHAHLYLDTDPGLTHANAIYEALGFEDIPLYYDNPLGGQSRYMRLKL